MAHALAAFRSALYFLFLVVTIVPWATVAVIYSIFVRGARLYWVCAGWLTLSVWGARMICGVQARVHGRENLPDSPVVCCRSTSRPGRRWPILADAASPVLRLQARAAVHPFFGWAMARMD